MPAEQQYTTATIMGITPANGNKPGKLHTNVGDITCFADKLGYFQVGKTYDIPTYDREYKGNWSKNVSKSGSISEVAPPPPSGQQMGAAVAHQPHVPVQAPVPQPAQQPAQFRQGEDPKAEEIFITGVVGRAMQSGGFAMQDIQTLTWAARDAWRNRNQTFRTEPRQTNHAAYDPAEPPPPNGPEDYGVYRA